MEQSYTAPTVPCPPELVGVAALFQGLTPAQRAAAASAIYGTLAGMLALADREPIGDPPPPLTAEQRAVIDYLREHGVTSSEQLAHHTGYSERTIKDWCGPNGILRAHGVVSVSRGYAVQ